MAEADAMGRRRPEQIIREQAARFPTFSTTQYGGNISFEETKLTSEQAKQLLPSIHNTLTALGLVPGAGIVFDIADAGVYSLEALFAKDSESRKSAMAGMALAGTAAIPLGGLGVGFAKLGKNLQKSSEEVMSLGKEAQEIAKKAEDTLAKLSPNPSSKELADLDKLNNAFDDIVNKQLPKAKEQFSDLLNQADEALKSTKTKASQTVTDATAGMSAKNRIKYLEETQNILGDIKKSTADDIKKFKEIRTGAKKTVKQSEKGIPGATDTIGYVRYSQDVAARGKLPPATQKRLNKLDDELGVTAKNQPLEQRRVTDFQARNPDVSLAPSIVRPSKTELAPVVQKNAIEKNVTPFRTTTDTRARGNPAQELILRQRQARRRGFSGASESQRRNFRLVPDQKRLPAPPTTSTGSTVPVPDAGTGMAGARSTPTATPTSTPTSTSMPPINPSAAPSATRTYPTPSGSPTVNVSTPTRAGRDLPFPNVPTQTVLNTTKTGKPFPRQPVRAGDEALQGTAGFTSRMPGASLRRPILTPLAMGGVMGLTAAGRAIQMSRADQQRKENQLRQEEARRQIQREAEEAFSVGQEEAEEAFNASGAKAAPTTRATSSSDTAPNWRDSMPSGRVAPKTLFDAAMPVVPVPPQPQKSKEPVDPPEPNTKDQKDLRTKIINSIDVDKTRKREQDRINRLQLQARRALGTGKPRGGGVGVLRTEPQRLNRIEEGQASIAADQTPRDEALRRARQRMDTVRAAQRGRDQFYKDIVKDPRGLRVPTDAFGGTRTIPRRSNPYIVGPAPEIQNQTVRDAFEDTPANRKRIRTMADGQFAGLIDEDETKKPRRRRASLLRRR